VTAADAARTRQREVLEVFSRDLKRERHSLLAQPEIIFQQLYNQPFAHNIINTEQFNLFVLSIVHCKLGQKQGVKRIISLVRIVVAQIFQKLVKFSFGFFVNL